MQTTHRAPAPIAPVDRHVRADLGGLSCLAVALVVIGNVFFGRVTGGVDALLVLAGCYVGTRVLRGDPLGGLVRRVVPPLVLVLAVSGVLTLLVQPQTRWEAFAEQTLAGLGFYQNWLLATTGDYAQASEAVTPLQQLWALSVAGQVSVAFLVLAWLIRRRAVLLAVTAVAMLASLVWAVIEDPTNQTVAYYSTLTRAWEVLAGVLAATVVVAWPRWLRLAGVTAGVAALLAASVLIDGVAEYPGPWALVPVVATVSVIVSGGFGGRWGPLAYPLYLWHWPLLIFWLAYTNSDIVGPTEGLGIVAASVLAAVLTWRFVEVPTSSWQSLAVGMLTAILVVLLLVTSVGWREHVAAARDTGGALSALSMSDYPGAHAVTENLKTARLPVRPTGLEAAKDVPPSTIDQCLADFAGETVVSCVYGDPRASRTIALAGGSHSEHWLTALHALGVQHGFRVTTYLKMGCPLTTAEVPVIAGADNPYPACRTWSDNALAQIIADRPDYVFSTTTRPILDGPGDFVPEHYLGIWDELSAHGIAMLGIRDTPWMVRNGRFFSPVDCLADGDDADTCGLARDEALRDRNPFLDYAARYPMISSLDLSDAVCRPTVCRAAEGNVLVYHDAHHLSSTYVRTLADELGRQVGEATRWW